MPRDPEKVKAQRRRYQQGRRARIAEIIATAKDKPCADCGKRYPSFVMEFDHCGSEKLYAIADFSRYPGRALQRLRDEIAKCDVVCSNCHKLRHPPT